MRRDTLQWAVHSARFGGAASGRLWRSRPVPRLSQRPFRSNRFRLVCHLPSTRCRPPHPPGPPSGDRYSPLSLAIRRAIHRLSAALPNQRQKSQRANSLRGKDVTMRGVYRIIMREQKRILLRQSDCFTLGPPAQSVLSSTLRMIQVEAVHHGFCKKCRTALCEVRS